MLTQALLRFIESSTSFSVLFECGTALLGRTKVPLAVLDSSFNPPHEGHYSLLTDFTATLDSHIILLLSISNADKGSPDLIALSHRLEMMTLLAKRIAQDHPAASVLVAATKHAMFVHKALEIHRTYNSPATFLMGYDTLIRMLDPKYYAPQSLAKAVGPFFDVANLFVLTRDEEGSSADDQKSWVQNISLSKVPQIPLLWAQHIHLKKALGPFSSVSSSQIRRDILMNDSSWRHYVIPDIQAFIETKKLYRNE